jgi:ATP-dependent DNA ligase
VFPGFVPPCLPMKAKQPPTGGLWLHEIKHDGFRIIARNHRDRVRLTSERRPHVPTGKVQSRERTQSEIVLAQSSWS